MGRKQKLAAKKDIPTDDVKDEEKPKKKTAPPKPKPKETTQKIKRPDTKTESNDTLAKTRKVMPSKPLGHKSSTPPPSKLKKEEKNRLSKMNRGSTSTRKAKEKALPRDGRKVDE